MTYFTADHHFGHTNIIKYCKRPFETVEEMDETLLNNWNNTILPQDIVYHLGDLSFRPQKYLPFLNGKIIFIKGNHDNKQAIKYIKKSGIEIYDYLEIRKETNIILCHYPFARWNQRHYGSWHLHGHCHGTFKGEGRIYDVGVDNNNYMPVSLVEIEGRMKGLRCVNNQL